MQTHLIKRVRPVGYGLTQGFTGKPGATMPPGAIGLWYFDQYTNNPTPVVPNQASPNAVSKSQLRLPRRFFAQGQLWGVSGGATVVDQAATANDGSNDASTLSIGASASSFLFQAVSLNAGSYTAAVWVKSNTGGNQAFRLGNGNGLAPTDTGSYTATTSWQRFTYTFTLGSPATAYVGIYSGAGNTACNLQIIDFDCFIGGSDLGTPTLGGHIYLGYGGTDTSAIGTYSQGALDLSSGGFGYVQFQANQTYGDFTGIVCTAKTATPTNNYNAFLSDIKNDGNNITMFVDSVGAPTITFGNASPALTQPAGFPLTLLGDGFHVWGFSYSSASTTLSIYLDGRLLAGVISSPASAGSFADWFFNSFASISNNSGLKYAGIAALYPRALSIIEIEQATAASLARANPFNIVPATAPKDIVVFEGDSITAGEPYATFCYPSYVTFTNRTYAAVFAQSGTFFQNGGELRASLVRSTIPPAAWRGSEKYILSALFGANDLQNSGLNVTNWLAELATYFDRWKALSPNAKVIGITVTPCIYINETTRTTVNTTILSWVGTHIDVCADFASDPNYGQYADASDTSKYPDGLHPVTAGQQAFAAIYQTAVNSL